ncbi:MAG: hypothetical protein FWE45_05020 [Firmicutes bacterium]|nr:hypothetical protein [Bacillota bacterium]
MEKLALFEIDLSKVKLTIYNIKEGEHFTKCEELVERLDIDEDIREDELIKGPKIREVITMLGMFKKICEAEGVSRYLAVCSACVTNAKNYQTFVDECATAIGIEFRVMTPEQEINALYTATINTLDAPRGLIINISSNSTKLIHYNRRIVIESMSLPIGTNNFMGGEADLEKAAVAFKKMLATKAGFLANVDPEALIVLTGDSMAGFGMLSRKIGKYPLDVNHNYSVDRKSIDDVLKFLGTLDPVKQQKIKGVSSTSVTSILAGLHIAKAITSMAATQSLVLSDHMRSAGLLFHYALPFTVDRGVTDLLGYSLFSITESVGLKKKNCDQMYDLALTLFKQLKVMHKLPRGYARILRSASYLYHIGKKTGGDNWSKQNYNIILSLPLIGLSHKEIVLTAFVASCRKWEDFNLSEWVKYKDITTDEDLEALRKLANILAIAEALNIRAQDIVKDITCDILGDSVILKLITDLDTKAKRIDPNTAMIEIYYAKKYKNEFAKTFKKNLEIL